MNKVIFWDFHNTLAYRPRMFASSLTMVLDEYESGNQKMDEDFLPFLQSGFPWQEPYKEYHHLIEPAAWWNNIYSLFEKAFIANGVAPEKALFYAKESRKYLVDPEFYTLYDDTVETLEFFKLNGYRNIILSNHIPELPEIAEKLGLMPHVDICISSANVGLEKPNPGIFNLAYEMAGNPGIVWMVGDNLDADVRGAESVGIKAILVRKPADADQELEYFSPDLAGVKSIIME